MQNFFNSLSESEKTELDNLVYIWKRETAEKVAAKIVLNEEEKKLLVNKDRIGAIKNIKDRYNCTLTAAKIAIDNFLEGFEVIPSPN